LLDGRNKCLWVEFVIIRKSRNHSIQLFLGDLWVLEDEESKQSPQLLLVFDPTERKRVDSSGLGIGIP